MLARINYLTAGESHGKGLLGIIDGLPAGLEINEEYIAHDLFRRQQGHGRGGRMKIENDYAEIYTGVRHGKSLGSPIGLILPNKDWKNWTKKMSCDPIKGKIKKVTLPRPGHADLTGIQKYDFDDIRNVLERSSARETAMRVALAAICRKLLKDIGIEVGSRVIQIHKVKDETRLSEQISPEKMNLDTANKLLKLFEEPSEGTVFLMITENQEELLPTILSRMQRIKIRKFNNN